VSEYYQRIECNVCHGAAGFNDPAGGEWIFCGGCHGVGYWYEQAHPATGPLERLFVDGVCMLPERLRTKKATFLIYSRNKIRMGCWDIREKRVLMIDENKGYMVSPHNALYAEFLEVK